MAMYPIYFLSMLQVELLLDYLGDLIMQYQLFVLKLYLSLDLPKYLVRWNFMLPNLGV